MPATTIPHLQPPQIVKRSVREDPATASTCGSAMPGEGTSHA